MIRKIFLVFILFMGVLAAGAQTCTLRFTGTDNQRQHYVKLDHVNIFNKTQLWQEVIYWPDTTLVLGGTGLDEYDIEKGYRIKQNTPNPFTGSTEFAITLPQERSVMIEIFDITGKRVVGKSFGMLEAGTHDFNVTLQTPNTYIVNATIKDGQMTIKMINEGHGAANEISYAGMRGMSEIKRGKGERYVESYPFAAGDMMEYTGFAVIDGVEYQSAVVEQPQHASATIKLVFTLGVPTVATLGVSNIGNYSATVSGNVTDDGGAEVTARGICWSTTQNPTVSNSHIANGSGIGTFKAVINNFSPSTTYYVRAYATNSAGTAYGSQVSFTTLGDGQPCPATPTVTDIDGNVYNTVQIGEQCWMRENLRTTHYSDGTAIAYGSTSSTTTAYRYYPINNSGFIIKYGYLYNWKAVMGNSYSNDANPSGVQGICPTGWHMPSDAEWMQLIDYVGSQSGYVCENNNSNIAKALAATTGWSFSTNSCAVGNDQSENNATGFCALPAGNHYGSSFYASRNYAYFWSSTKANSSAAFSRYLYDYGAEVEYTFSDRSGYSVRCLRDYNDQIPCPETPAVTDFDGNVYNTVQIGEQCWMKENLRTTHYADGTSIALGSDTSTIAAYRYYPDNNSSNVATYGYLYNWPAVMHGASSSFAIPSGVQGICPTGWHVPSMPEWGRLKNYVSSQSEYVCGSDNANIAKALASTSGWNSSTISCAVGNDQSANNATGFSAVPAGGHVINGSSVYGLGMSALFWSCSHSFGAEHIELYYGFTKVVNGLHEQKYNGYSVRCVKD